MPVAAPSLPEPGQVVEVRGSTWAVANVQAQGLPLSPADDATAQLNHVIDLQSLDEDRLGEQLSVIWELEGWRVPRTSAAWRCPKPRVSQPTDTSEEPELAGRRGELPGHWCDHQPKHRAAPASFGDDSNMDGRAAELVAADTATIAVTNDVHSSILENPGLWTFIMECKSQGCIIADSGDFFEGTLEYDLFGGQAEQVLISELYDVVAPGNHGFEIYEEMARSPGFPPVIQSNLSGWPGPNHWVSPDRKFVFAATMSKQAFNAVSIPARRQYDAVAPYDAIKRISGIAASIGARTIVLSHQGFEQDIQLAEKLQEADFAPAVIFSGHCHSEHSVHVGSETLIAKAPAYGEGVTIYSAANASVTTVRMPEAERRSGQHITSLRSYKYRYATETRAGNRAKFAIPKEIATDRYGLLLALSDAVSAEYGRPTLLNRGTVCSQFTAYPDYQHAEMHRVIPFDNQLIEVQLAIPTDSAIELLSAQYGEECCYVGNTDISTLITTDFIAERLELSRCITQRTDLSVSLRTFAAQWVTNQDQCN